MTCSGLGQLAAKQMEAVSEKFKCIIIFYFYFPFFFLQRAKIALAAFTATESREKVVDFSVPFMHYTDEMLLKKTSSSNGTIDFLQFMSPFHNNVWFATLATLAVISVAVFVINYLSPYGYKDDNGRGTSQEFSFINSLWFALACMLQQGPENQPRNVSGTVERRGAFILMAACGPKRMLPVT